MYCNDSYEGKESIVHISGAGAGRGGRLLQRCTSHKQLTAAHLDLDLALDSYCQGDYDYITLFLLLYTDHFSFMVFLDSP